MAETPKGLGLVQALLLTHNAITRGLKISTSRGADFLQAGFPDAAIQQGYTLYTQALATVLQAHHRGEDELVFPMIREKVTAAPYDSLARHHQLIIAQLGPVMQVIPRLGEKGDPADLAALVDGLQKITSIWRPHIQAEEWYFSEQGLAEVLNLQEQEQAGAALLQFGQEHATPSQLAMPFLLFNLAPDERAVMAAELPEGVVQELIPKTWKEQWSPMQPFLLE